MPLFAYQARDEAGRLVKGLLEAESKVALADRLRKMGYLVTRMEEGAATFTGFSNIRFGRLVSQEQLLMTVVQLANLVEAGIALVSCLASITSQLGPGALREALEMVARDVEAGRPFSEALSRYPRVFPALMVRMVAVGEGTGELDTVLSRFAGFLERDLSLRRTVQGALTYPVLLLGLSTLLLLFVVTFVVPQFAILFAKAGLSLPAPTLFISGLGQAIRTRWWLFGFLGAAAFLGFGLVARVPAVRYQIHRGLLRLPVVGMIIHQTLVARFSRSLATLVASGIPILGALEMAGGVVGNQVFVQELNRVRSAVERGERIATTLSVGKVFRPDVVQMIRAGEESGRLDAMLDKIADFYDLRINFSLKQLTTLLEPILLIGMGGVIALIMSSLLLPMFDLVKVLQHGGLR